MKIRKRHEKMAAVQSAARKSETEVSRNPESGSTIAFLESYPGFIEAFKRGVILAKQHQNCSGFQMLQSEGTRFMERLMHAFESHAENCTEVKNK